MISFSNINDNVSCPISVERIDEKIVRLVATQVVLLGIVFIFVPNIWIPLFLAIDFSIRSFTSLNISILSNIAKIIRKNFFDKNPQLTDRAPKRFAAGIGVIFSVSIALAYLIFWYKTAVILTSILLVCAILEAFLGVCVGCYVYHFLFRGRK